MTSFSTTNATALTILRSIAERVRSSEWGASTSESQTAPGLALDPIGAATKQSGAAAIVAILKEDGAKLDLTSAKSAVTVIAENYATIATGDGNDYVSAKDYATVTTNGGNDGVAVYDYAKVSSGAGDDVISVHSYAVVDASDGNDAVYTYGHATVSAGAGEDLVDTGDDSIVDAGEGDDWIQANRRATVDGGGGNDEIRTYEYSTVDAGDGDDFVVTLGSSTIKGGAGNDTLVVTHNRSQKDSTFDNANVDGGEGDDYIQVNGKSTVTGGTGNDTIRLIGDGNTVIFNKGDGQDVIGIGHIAKDSATIRFAGYSADDVTVTQGTDSVTVSFKGSDDSLTLQFAYKTAAKLAFDDGSTVDIAASRSTAMKWICTGADSLPEWSRPVLHF